MDARKKVKLLNKISNEGERLKSDEIIDALTRSGDELSAAAEEEIRRRYRAARADMGHPQPPHRSSATLDGPEQSSVSYRWLRARRAIYARSAERVLVVTWGFGAIVLGLAAVLGLSSGVNLQALALLGTGVIAFALVVQSGRVGYLIRENRNEVEDLGASLKVRVVRGHDHVHEVEADVVRRATSDLLTLELWHQPRSSMNTRPFVELQEAIRDWIAASSDRRFFGLMGSTPRNWRQCRDIVRSRLEYPNASQRFLLGNPLQVDVTLSESEAMLSFPLRTADRGLALHIASPDVVQDLWDIFMHHAWESSDDNAIDVLSEADLVTVAERMQASRSNKSRTGVSG